MFTGLVQKVGALVARRPGAEHETLIVAASLDPRDLERGASVAVNGVCLTVTEAKDGRISFDAAFETLERTTLGRLPIGQRLNLEPALRMGDALGGHLVSGHVDGVGTVRSVTARGEAREIWFDVPGSLVPYCAPKGSICIDGTSLTINEADDRGLAVGIVPHTLQATTLGGLESGHEVNLEVDLIARYVARLMQFGGSEAAGPATVPPSKAQLSVDDLVDAGYLDPGEGRR